MMVISRTPIRISFFGGGSDYPAYYKRKKGAVLGTTIDKYIYISINTMGDFFDHKIRISYSKTELVKSVDEIEHPSVRECLKFKKIPKNLDVHIFSDFPAKTGLGSSSSFTTGLLHALYALQNKRISKQKLAEESCLIEQKKLCENVGSQDQFHAAFGGFNLIEFNCDQITVRPLLLSKKQNVALEDHLMVFYTGMTRFANLVLGEQIAKTEGKKNDEYLERMVEIALSAFELGGKTDAMLLPELFGKLLHTSWELKKKLSSKISNSTIDGYYQKAIASGAYGGKLCGAGNGGVLIFLAPISKKQDIRLALQDLLEVPVRFEGEGSSIIYRKRE